MSTEITLKYGQHESTGFHLYREGLEFDKAFVYLELTGVAFEASTSFDLSGDGLGKVVVRIPVAIAGKLGLIDGRPEVKG
jgi:hypothetical protein